jgi:hypothetical protein
VQEIGRSEETVEHTAYGRRQARIDRYSSVARGIAVNSDDGAVQQSIGSTTVTKQRGAVQERRKHIAARATVEAEIGVDADAGMASACIRDVSTAIRGAGCRTAASSGGEDGRFLCPAGCD